MKPKERNSHIFGSTLGPQRSVEAGMAHAFKDLTVYAALQVTGSSGEKQSVREAKRKKSGRGTVRVV